MKVVWVALSLGALPVLSACSPDRHNTFAACQLEAVRKAQDTMGEEQQVQIGHYTRRCMTTKGFEINWTRCEPKAGLKGDYVAPMEMCYEQKSWLNI